MTKEIKEILPIAKQRMNVGAEKKEKSFQNSVVHVNGDVRASVMKFAQTPEELLTRYNPDCWVKVYEHPEVAFRIGSSPIIENVDYTFGRETTNRWVGITLIELADKEFIKLPAERGSSLGIADSLHSDIKHWRMSEWIFFCEMLKRGNLGEVKRFMATSELHSYIRQFDLFRQQERKKIEDAHRLSYEEKECCILSIIYDKFTDTFDVCDRTTAAKNNFVRCEILKPIIDWCNQQGIVINKEMSDKDVKQIIYWYKYIFDSHALEKIV